MTEENFADWVLPGFRDQPHIFLGACMTACFGHSRVSNRRRLEDHFHPMWMDIFYALLYDLRPHVFPAAQVTLYLDSSPLENPDISTHTIPDGDALEFVPDFMVIRPQQKPYSVTPDTYFQWIKYKMDLPNSLLLAELKSCPSRSILRQEDFIQALEIQLSLAISDTEHKVVFLFATESTSEEVILMALSGEFFRFKVARRAEYERRVKKLLLLNRKPNKPTQLRSPPIPQHSQHRRMRHEEIAQTSYCGQVVSSVTEIDNDARAVDSKGRRLWSDVFLLGTGAANQRLHFIHEFLSSQGVRENVTTDSESEPPSGKDDPENERTDDEYDEENTGIVSYGPVEEQEVQDNVRNEIDIGPEKSSGKWAPRSKRSDPVKATTSTGLGRRSVPGAPSNAGYGVPGPSTTRKDTTGKASSSKPGRDNRK